MSRPLPPDGPSDETLDELTRLPSTAAPPPHLEERVVDALRDQGLVSARQTAQPRHKAGPRWWLTAAACLLAAVGGWTVRGLAAAPGDPTPPDGADNRYLVMLLEPEALRTDKPVLELAQEYWAWAQPLVRDGRLAAAGRLEHEPGLYLAETVAQPAPGVTDLTGFFLVRGRSLAEVEEIFATCPHLGYGGEISIRELARNN